MKRIYKKIINRKIITDTDCVLDYVIIMIAYLFILI